MKPYHSDTHTGARGSQAGLGREKNERELDLPVISLKGEARPPTRGSGLDGRKVVTVVAGRNAAVLRVGATVAAQRERWRAARRERWRAANQGGGRRSEWAREECSEWGESGGAARECEEGGAGNRGGGRRSEWAREEMIRWVVLNIWM
jgi:hypothetical protein